MRQIKFGMQLPSSIETDFETIAAYAAKCEEVGFDSVWVSDHILLFNGRGMYEPLTLLSALAARTSKIGLGTAVLVPTLRNPVFLADVVGVLQKISNNRFILGAGAGWVEPEFDNLGADFHNRGKVIDESLALMKRLWKGE